MYTCSAWWIDFVFNFLEGMSKQSDMSLTLAEIHKVDPSFDKEMFINECKTDIIPTILEAFLQGKVDILKDWCHEAVSLRVPTRVLVYHCLYVFFWM